MNDTQLAQVVARIQAGDNRSVDAATVTHFRETIGALDYQDAMAAVRMHFTSSAEYLTAAHIVANARAIARDRVMRAPLVSGRRFAPKPTNMAALEAAHRSGDRVRVAEERAVYNRQCVDAGFDPVPEWGLV